MTAPATRTALETWGLTGATLTLMAQRENHVYRAACGGTSYALRLHRPGYQSAAEIRSELVWMQELHASGLPVPKPIPAKDGALLHDVGTQLVSVLSWLPGRPMGTTGVPLDLPDRTGTFGKLGALMASLHDVSDRWARPADFTRQHWDAEGLIGDGPLWGPFWENPGLSAQMSHSVVAARDRLRADIRGATRDYGLVHADMLRENVMLDGDALGLIDFDDSGFGYRLFDVATALLKNRAEPDYPALEAALLAGYHSVRALDMGHLPQFMLIRALSYLGWIIPRMNEPGAADRQARFIAAAKPLLQDYLES